MAHRNPPHMGRRGLCLLLFGLIYLLIGLGWLVAPIQEGDELRYHVILDLTDGDMWPAGVAFALAGLIAVFTARWPGGRWQKAGFTALSTITTAWTVVVVVGWLVYDSPRGYLAATVWGLLLVLLNIVAGWPEPPPSPTVVAQGADEEERGPV